MKSGGWTILIVEDNADDEAMTLRALKQHILQDGIAVVRDGQEALDFLFCESTHANRDPAEMPQLVLLDLQLPKLDGKRVLERIRADPRTCLLPVVVLTSSDEQRDLLDSYGLGANSYVRKPVDYTDYTDSVRRIGQYWMLLNKAPPAPSLSNQADRP